MFLCLPKTLHNSFLPWDMTFYRILQIGWLMAFWLITQEPELCQIWDWWWKINNNISFHFRLFPRKTNEKNFQKIQKALFRGHFGPFLPKFGWKWIFLERKALSVFKYSDCLPLCQKSEKTNEPFLRKTPNWWTDRQHSL